jgi:MFS family permease
MIFSVMLFSATTGYDNSMMNGLQALTNWQAFMNHPAGARLGGINAIQAGGSCLGYPLMSIIANKWGRKPSIYIGLFVISFGVALQVAAQNPGMFIAARLFVGMSSGFFGSAPLLITEIAYPTHRAKVTSGYK